VSDDVAAPAVHVLLVEDHVQLRGILEQVLRAHGYRVTAVESADGAVSALESGTTADVVLSDIRMPGRMNGLDLAHWVRAKRPQLAILLQTGFADVDTKDFPLLRKPFTPEELVDRLQSVVMKSGSSQ
jgi:CheY-like chemotaxis protein